MQKVILLAYANDPENHLDTLKKEYESVYDLLLDRYFLHGGEYIVIREEFTTVDKLNRRLHQLKDRIAIFQFSGHADFNAIKLKDMAAKAEGIAAQLHSDNCPNLKLVILNGCCTSGQIDYFFKAGVPVVIGTTSLVNDLAATRFAIRFWRNLLHGDLSMSIEKAWEDALNPAKTSLENNINERKMRWVQGLGSATVDDSNHIWDLKYLNENYIKSNPIPVRKSDFIQIEYKPNQKLADTFFEVCKNHISLKTLIQVEKHDNKVDFSERKNRILNILPYPIGIHLNKLFRKLLDKNKQPIDVVSEERLKYCGLLFHASVEFMALIMLADLYQQCNGDGKQIHDDLKEMIQGYFNEPNKLLYPYIPLIKKIRQFLESLKKEQKSRGKPYFIEELDDLKNLIEKDSQFLDACDYLFKLHVSIQNRKQRFNNIALRCKIAEEKLCVFFSPLRFLHLYELTSIRNMQVEKFFFQEKPKYDHVTVPLMRTFIESEVESYKLPQNLDNKSVLLLKKGEKTKQIKKGKNKIFEFIPLDH